jgi:septal ring factor EnvC (AmiA/AmiB activator)
MFPRVAAHVLANIELFQDAPSFFDLPITFFGSLFPGDIPPRNAEFVRSYLDCAKTDDPAEIERERRSIAQQAAELRREIQQCDAHAEKIATRRESVDREIAALEAEIGERRQAVMCMQADIDAENAEATKLNAQLEEIRREIAKINREKAEMEEETCRVCEQLK